MPQKKTIIEEIEEDLDESGQISIKENGLAPFEQ